MNMSLNTFCAITWIVVAAVLIITVSIDLGYFVKKKLNKDEEKVNMTAKFFRSIFRNEKPLAIMIAEGIGIAIAGIMMLSMAFLINTYEKYGACYEEEYTLPMHQILANCIEGLEDDTQRLQRNLEISNTNLNDYDIILVRFGCKDCHTMKDYLIQYKNENNAYVVNSRSELGQKIVDKYVITDVPCTINHGLVQYYN